MKEKTASEILRLKVPTEYSDELFKFSQDLPMGMNERFHALISHLIPAVYYADRIDENEWLAPNDIDIVQPGVPLLLLYESGSRLQLGYHGGDSYLNMDHQYLPVPQLYRYINLPIE